MKKAMQGVIIVLAVLLIDMTAGQAAEQTTCPVMGGTINKHVYADYQGKRIYFCCAGCIETFQKDPEKYIKQMESAGVELEKTVPSPDTKKQ